MLAIDHVNLVVRDLAAMTAFYRDVLGLRVTKEVTIHGAWVDAVVGLDGVEADVVYLELEEGPRVELIDYRVPAGQPPTGRSAPNLHGFRHIALRVDDIEAAVTRLRDAGVSLVGDIQTVPSSQVKYSGGAEKRLVYFLDCEQNLLELCEYRG